MEFEILGKPMSKARPRLGRNGFVYTPKNTIMYENFVKLSFQNKYPNHKPSEGLIEAEIIAIFEIPKSYSKKKAKELLETNYSHKPDLDNIAKIILDSLNTIAYKDDSQVVTLKITKVYGEQAKVKVKLKEIL